MPFHGFDVSLSGSRERCGTPEKAQGCDDKSMHCVISESKAVGELRIESSKLWPPPLSTYIVLTQSLPLALQMYIHSIVTDSGASWQLVARCIFSVIYRASGTVSNSSEI